MLKKMRLLCLALTLGFGVQAANAGVGLSVYAVYNLSQGYFLAAAIDGGIGAASIAGGINRVKKGKIGWGVFFLILEENNVITSEDAAKLSALEVSEQEYFLSIVESDASVQEKAVELANF